MQAGRNDDSDLPETLAGTPAAPGTASDQLVIAGFRIVRAIGRGGMGVVYEAIEESLGRRVALKILPANITASSKDLERFRREASIASRLEHAGIVHVYRIGESHGNVFFAMELVEGGSLQDHLNELRGTLDRGQSTMEAVDEARIREVVKWSVQAADALHAAHEAGVIHRDVKPANILLSTDGRVRLTDFGLAREQTADALTMTGEFMGTPAYMSPEQALASRVTIDHRSDVYSLGVTLYECLTLRTPFGGDSIAEILQQLSFKSAPHPSSVNSGIPKDLSNVVLKAIEKDPDRRYPTMQSFADDLRAFLASEPVRARPISVWRRLRRRAQRHPRLVATAVAVLTAALFVSGIGYGYLSTGMYLLISESTDEPGAVLVARGRPGWSVPGFPQPVSHTGFFEDDLRSQLPTEFRRGVPVTGSANDELLEALTPHARARALDSLGRHDGATEIFRSSLAGGDADHLDALIVWAELAGDDDLWSMLVESDLSWFASLARNPVGSARWDALNRWMAGRPSEQSGNETVRLLNGDDQHKTRAMQFLAGPAPHLPSVNRALAELLQTEAGVASDLQIPARARLLWHLDPQTRRVILLSHARHDVDSRLFERSLEWLDRTEDSGAIAVTLSATARSTNPALGPLDVARIKPELVLPILENIGQDARTTTLGHESVVSTYSRLVKPNGKQELERWLSHAGARVRQRAARVIMSMGGSERALQESTARFQDPSSPVARRLSAAVALLHGPEPSALEAAGFYLENVPRDSSAAVKTLSRSAARYDTVRQALTRASEAGSGPAASLATLTLWTIGNTDNPQILLDAVSAGHGWSVAAADALGSVNDDALRTEVIRQLRSQVRPAVRADLQRTLVAYLRRQPLDTLVDHLDDRSESVRTCAELAAALRSNSELRSLETDPSSELEAVSLAAGEILLHRRHREQRHRRAHAALVQAAALESAGRVADARMQVEWALEHSRDRVHVAIVEQHANSSSMFSRYLLSSDCPDAALHLVKLNARHGWIGAALDKAKRLLAEDPRWHGVLSADPELDDLRRDPRLSRALLAASLRARSFDPPLDRPAPWPCGI
ncbi:MAG: serine/threonine protein kinase [bacterium]|nr:serine/threonine protein kinase [bacterium]